MLGNAETGIDSADPRWQLVERVISSAAFQKSARLRDLLRYLTERSIHDHGTELTEQRIGRDVFGKPTDYSPTDDSSVRVHIRQLRLKLHEYFNSEGRHESLIVEIPKGAYAPIFRPAHMEADRTGLKESEPPRRKLRIAILLPWLLTVVMTALCVVMWSRGRAQVSASIPPPWPLSVVFDNGSRTQVIVADSNYTMLRILTRRSWTLDEYLKPDFQQSFVFPQMGDPESRIVQYIARSLLTSYADAAVVSNIVKMSGDQRDRISVRSARDLRLRDLREGNYIFLGSPTSNPWATLFENRLNFQEVEDTAGSGSKFFRNKRPRSGEQPSYHGLSGTGTTGEDYATISVLPTESRRGHVMLFQGLRQEGTEAAGFFLAGEGNRQLLRKALGIGPNVKEPESFELLLRTRALSGSPSAATIVAARILE